MMEICLVGNNGTHFWHCILTPLMGISAVSTVAPSPSSNGKKRHPFYTSGESLHFPLIPHLSTLYFLRKHILSVDLIICRENPNPSPGIISLNLELTGLMKALDPTRLYCMC